MKYAVVKDLQKWWKGGFFIIEAYEIILQPSLQDKYTKSILLNGTIQNVQVYFDCNIP